MTTFDGPGRIDLHIGVEKTGSSTLQSFFDRNRPGLLERGVLYPTSIGRGNHSTLAVIGRDDEVLDDLRRQRGLAGPADVRAFRSRKADGLRQECAAAGVERLLLSSEHCSSRLLQDGEVERLRAWLDDVAPGAELHVHVYLRRQDAMHESRYSTVVRMGGTDPLRVPTDEEYANLYDFEALLDRWARVVGEASVHPRRFERSRLVGGDVVHDLAEALGLDVGELTEQVEPGNTALDQPTQEFLRLVNRHVPRLGVDGRTLPARTALLRAVDEAPNVGGPAGLPDDQAAELLDRVAAGNARVAERWFDGEELFSPRRPRAVERVALDLERAVELAAAALLAVGGHGDPAPIDGGRGAAHQELDAARREVAALRQQNAAMRARIEKLEGDRELLRSRLDALRASRSYRLARALTAPLRGRG